MTLKLLAKEISEEIRNKGVPNFFIWKRGRMWSYNATFYDENLCPPLELVKEVDVIKEFLERFDKNYIILNTEKYFNKYKDLKYLELYIKEAYEKKGEENEKRNSHRNWR